MQANVQRNVYASGGYRVDKILPAGGSPIYNVYDRTGGAVAQGIPTLDEARNMIDVETGGTAVSVSPVGAKPQINIPGVISSHIPGIHGTGKFANVNKSPAGIMPNQREIPGVTTGQAMMNTLIGKGASQQMIGTPDAWRRVAGNPGRQSLGSQRVNVDLAAGAANLNRVG